MIWKITDGTRESLPTTDGYLLVKALPGSGAAGGNKTTNEIYDAIYEVAGGIDCFELMLKGDETVYYSASEATIELRLPDPDRGEWIDTNEPIEISMLLKGILYLEIPSVPEELAAEYRLEGEDEEDE
jgi:hypothetical protein